MRRAGRRLGAAILAAVVGASLHPPGLGAQATTAAISGRVATADSGDADGAEVEVINRASGFLARAVVSRGRFFVPSLEVGGPYSIVVRRIGFRPEERDGVVLSLGETRALEFRLEPVATKLGELVVAADRRGGDARPGAGIATVIGDSSLRRLPSADRDLYDFVSLSPHVSTRFGVSGGGVNFHFDNFQIDGATAQALHGRNPAGVAADGKAISLEAVKEYQVLLAPFDVSQGDFAGALVNGVTRSGTDEWHGDGFVYYRNERLARDVPLLRDSPFDRAQYGLSVGGPIVRDRANIFVAAEFQHLAAPAPGPYLGEPATAAAPVPISAADIDRFTRLLQAYGLEAGSPGPVSNGNPLANLFARLDVAIPAWNGRLVLRHSYGRADQDQFSRDPNDVGALYPLSTFNVQAQARTNVTVAQLFTASRSGSSNELVAEYYDGPVRFEPEVQQPLVVVNVPGVTDAGPAGIEAGTIPNTEHSVISQWNAELTDNLRLLLGSHRLTLGAKVERYHDSRLLVGGSYGSWHFLSLDSLQLGQASAYTVAKDFGGGLATVAGKELALYAGDQWRITDRLELTAGARAELPILDGHPPYSPAVDSAFGRRTDAMPVQRVFLSPRVGFDWAVAAHGRTRLRGGAGIFVGRPPLTFWSEAFSHYGAGIRTLSCGVAAGDAGPPPPFNPSFTNPPQACANGGTFDTNAGGPVTLLAPDLTYPRTFKASLGVEQRLPWGIRATVEGLYTRNVRDFVFVNRGLSGPVATDAHGRVLYGTIDSDGVAAPALVSQRFPQVIELRTDSHNYSYDVAVQLEKAFSDRLGASVSYTHSRVRDVQSPIETFALDAWQERPIAGRQDDLTLGVSDNDQPHRVVLGATWTAPWRRWRTDFSVLYLGGSGAPFTFTAAADPVTGDLNADGSNLNDPIYVPRSALDSTEIRFAGSPQQVAAQGQALERFISATPCLAAQRGRIMARNSCRAPWVHSLKLAVRQSLPSPRGQSFAMELQVFNFLNLLHSSWGWVQTPNSALLQQVAQTGGAPGVSQPVFKFDQNFVLLNHDVAASYFQFQLAFRVGF